MRYPTLLSVVLASLALAACGGSNEPAQSPDAEKSADKASEAAEKAEDKADKAADKADDAAHDANKAEKENESK
jgi:outer membrane PBP1 activator LpoA protein